MEKSINDLICQMELIHFGKPWIGVNFKTKIEALTTHDFFLKVHGMHSIAEIMSHLTTWRLETILKIKTGAGSITDNDPSNWKTNESLKKTGKKSVIKAHNESVSKLLDLLKNQSNEFLDTLYYDNDFKGKYQYKFVIQGMLHHDLYHLGQIGIIMKLIKMDSSSEAWL